MNEYRKRRMKRGDVEVILDIEGIVKSLTSNLLVQEIILKKKQQQK